MLQYKDVVMVCYTRAQKPDARVNIIVRCPLRARKITDVAVNDVHIYSEPVMHKGDRRNTIVGFTDRRLCRATAKHMTECGQMRIGSIQVEELKHVADLLSMPMVIIDGVYFDMGTQRTVVEVYFSAHARSPGHHPRTL